MAKLYKNWTLREKIIHMLEVKYSATQVESRNKYVVYSATMPGKGVYYFLLGTSGAVRINPKSPAASGAISKTETFHKMLAEFERQYGLGV
jgi:hypothetical protein